MMEIKSILFPTDFSEGSGHALKYAIDLADRYGAKLYLVHVIHDITNAVGWYVPHLSMDSMYSDLKKGAEKELDRFGSEELRGRKDVDRKVITGVPHDEIVKFVKDNKIDLIVIGAHSKKGIDRVLFGSTAAQIVRFAPCPVLTVRLMGA